VRKVEAAVTQVLGQGLMSSLEAAQLRGELRWDECMENVMGRQVRCVLEIGPGQALARMWSQRYPGVPARACDDFRSAEAIAAWLNSHAD
jgi:[acyl-carrier-protein] S-malonyltransferase